MALTPIIADITSLTAITVRAFNDGNISFGKYETKSVPCIVDACRHILKTVGLVSGKYAAQPYPMHIVSGTNVVFIVPSLLFGSKLTLTPEYSDIEVTRGTSFCGQIL